MKDFHVYSPTDIITSNLREVTERFGALREQEWAHLCELAEELAQAESLEELLSALPDHRPPAATEADSNPLLRGYASMQSVRLCKALATRLTEQKPFPLGAFFADGEPLSADASQRIIYQKSSYTDEAYLVFSTLLPGAQAFYAHSFHASCEAVYNGECEYCILPVENSVEGELSAFSRLIDRYELKIAASCEILGNATARSTRFALLRRRMLPIMEATDATYFFECAIPQGYPPQVADLLTAAKACGLRLYRINSLPQSNADATFAAHPCFLTASADLHAFLLYLAMEAPHYTPIGLYPHLKPKGT